MIRKAAWTTVHSTWRTSKRVSRRNLNIYYQKVVVDLYLVIESAVEFRVKLIVLEQVRSSSLRYPRGETNIASVRTVADAGKAKAKTCFSTTISQVLKKFILRLVNSSRKTSAMNKSTLRKLRLNCSRFLRIIRTRPSARYRS